MSGLSNKYQVYLSLSVALSQVVGCGLNEFREQEQRLDLLVAGQAQKADVIAVLGTNFSYSVKGQTNWIPFEQFLAREPANRLVAVRDRATRWPRVMYYSTPSMMTWIFLDENDRVTDFVVGAQ
jgi:hypothetical protein